MEREAIFIREAVEFKQNPGIAEIWELPKEPRLRQIPGISVIFVPRNP
jgi:hypothetical protein